MIVWEVDVKAGNSRILLSKMLQAGALAIALIAFPLASVPVRAGLHVLVARNDIGGRIDRCAEQLDHLRARGDLVEIRGHYCLSACTMYLGAESACTEPDTVFGFHGPSFWGLPVNDASFEYWSRVVASSYPDGLRPGYMQVARHRENGHYRVFGRELIGLGIQQCSD